MRVLRGIQACAIIFAASIAPLQARTAHDVKIPLSTAIQLLLPAGTFAAYQGTVDTGELVRLPHRGSKSERLVELLAAYNLQETTIGSTVTIFPFGSPPPTPPMPPSPTPVAENYSSPGFTMAPLAPPPTPVAVVRALPASSAGEGPQQASHAPALPAVTASLRPPTPVPPVSVAPLPPPPPPLPVWTLESGTLMSKDLQSWAPRAGWQIQWQFPRDFVIPATTTLTGQFPDVVRQVVGDLREQLAISDPNNANIHADTYNVNHVIIINSVSEANDHAD